MLKQLLLDGHFCKPYSVAHVDTIIWRQKQPPDRDQKLLWRWCQKQRPDQTMAATTRYHTLQEIAKDLKQELFKTRTSNSTRRGYATKHTQTSSSTSRQRRPPARPCTRFFSEESRAKRKRWRGQRYFEKCQSDHQLVTETVQSSIKMSPRQTRRAVGHGHPRADNWIRAGILDVPP